MVNLKIKTQEAKVKTFESEPVGIMPGGCYESEPNYGIMPGGCYGPEAGGDFTTQISGDDMVIGIPNPIISIGDNGDNQIKMIDVIDKSIQGDRVMYSAGQGNDVYDFRSVNGVAITNRNVTLYDHEGSNEAIIQHTPSQMDSIQVNYNALTNKVSIFYGEGNSVIFNHGDMKNIAVMHENMRFRDDFLVLQMNAETGQMDYFDNRSGTFLKSQPHALTASTEMVKFDQAKVGLLKSDAAASLAITKTKI